MRDIKFRAFNKKDGYYCDVHSIEWLNGGIFVQGPGVHIGNGWATESNGFKHDCDVVLEQFTGLKDKNGVDIYEGDIVSVIDAEMDRDKEIGKVAWYNCYCPAFDVYIKTDTSRTGFESYSDEFNTFTMDVIIEVIGNVHQNPELLEG